MGAGRDHHRSRPHALAVVELEGVGARRRSRGARRDAARPGAPRTSVPAPSRVRPAPARRCRSGSRDSSRSSSWSRPDHPAPPPRARACSAPPRRCTPRRQARPVRRRRRRRRTTSSGSRRSTRPTATASSRLDGFLSTWLWAVMTTGRSSGAEAVRGERVAAPPGRSVASSMPDRIAVAVEEVVDAQRIARCCASR